MVTAVDGRTGDAEVSEASRPDDAAAVLVEGAAVHQQPQLWLLQSLTGRLGETTLKVLVSETVGAVERHCIEAALAMTDGNRSAAAKMLGLSRQSLYMKLARYGISAD